MQDPVSTSKNLHAAYNNKAYWAGAFDGNHPDTARHYEMLRHGLSLVKNVYPQTLLTIGDNLARDAGFFKKAFPNCYCIASDLCTSGIRQAVIDRFVDEVQDVDVEHIPCNDESRDLVIAKEAFHHWPRPMLGFYEMMRVAKKAVLLIEPYDVVRSTIEPFIGDNTFTDRYEEVGNYVYQISLREIIKSAWSLYYPAVAAIGFNDPYSSNQTLQQWRAEKEMLDSMGYSGERQFNLMSIAVYKPGYQPAPETLPSSARLYQRPLNQYMISDKL